MNKSPIQKIDLNKSTLFHKKIQSEIKNETFEFFKRSEIKNFVEIPFDVLVNSEFPKELNQFNLVKKRTYCNILDLIIEYNNKIFNQYPLQEDLIMTYLAIKWKIDKKDYKDKEVFKLDENGKKILLLDEDGNKIRNEKGKIMCEKELKPADLFFLEDLYNQLFDDNFVEFIEEFIENNYTLNIDEKNAEKNTKFNPVLQFSDKHCKMLYCISIGMKVSIPLILHFSSMYGAKIMNDYLQKSFDYLFHLFTHGIDLYSKLWESVYSRVVVTKNSDKTYWNYVEIEGNSINKVTSSLYQKLIVDIIPKYVLDQNPISLNHVFINNNIDYTFRSNIEINYKPLNLAESEDDVSDWDKLSINTAKIDEGEIVISQCNIDSTIKKIIKTENIKISKNEFAFYEKDFVINKLQQNFIFNFFSRYFGSTETLFYCNRDQYILLLLIMKKILLNKSFELIPNIVTAKIDTNLKERVNLNKKILLKLKDSTEYDELLNLKYYFTENNIKNDSGIINKLIANIICNKFKTNNYKDDENNNQEIKYNNDLLLSEVFRFVSLV